MKKIEGSLVINTSKVSYESRAFKFGSAELGIRPYPKSRTELVIRDRAIVLPGINAKDMFVYCLEWWKKVTGEEGTELKISDELKTQIYDFNLGVIEIDGKEVSMSDFVIARAREMSEEISADSKN
jgi:hypothetical protein